MIYTLIKKDADGNIEKIFSFDSISSFSETWSGTVSKTPVEFGFPVSDHMSIENPVFDISGTLSSYSLFNESLEIFWDGEDFVNSNEDGDRAVVHLVAKENLTNIFLSRDTLTLLESDTNSFNYDNLQGRYEQLTSGFVKEYDNCVITGIGFDSNDNVNSSAVFAKIKVEQLNIAYVQTRELAEAGMQKAIVPRIAKSSTNVGSSDTSTTTDSSGNKPSANSVSEKKSDVTSVKNNIPVEYKNAFDQQANQLDAINKATYLSGDPNQMGRVVNNGGVFTVERKVIGQ